MLSLKRSIVAGLCLLTALIWSPGTSEAQVADTIVVTIQGKIDQVILTAEFVTPPRVGDTVFFRADVYDEDGDPATGFVYHWASEDPTALQIDQLEGNRARGIALKKSTVRVWVMIEPITSLEIAVLQQDGSLDWGRRIEATALEQQFQLCGYLHRRGVLVAESPGPPACPIVFLPPATPAMWPGPMIHRSLPWPRFYALTQRR